MAETTARVTEQRPPLPPFTHESALEKVRLAEDGWNTRDPARVALAYSVDLLGHKHLDSTRRYTRVTAHELRGAVKRLGFPTTEPATRQVAVL